LSQKAMPSLAQVFAKLRKASRQSRLVSLRVPPLIFRLMMWQRMSFSDPLVWSGISGRSRTRRSSGVEAGEQAVEGNETGAALEDAMEAGAQGGPALRRGIGLIHFEVTVEAPDQVAEALLGGALRVGEGVELMDEALGMALVWGTHYLEQDFTWRGYRPGSLCR
jgi:hypothetical protein